MESSRFKKIQFLVNKIIEPMILIIKRTRKRRSMPFKEIGQILKIFFPKTKHYKTGKGFFKHVFVIYSDKRKLVLKIGRNRKHIRKDYTTYLSLPQNIRTRYFAKIYWRHGLFLLQKFGGDVNVPDKELKRLKDIGKKYRLRDIRKDNIMKIDGKFKIVDAERK